MFLAEPESEAFISWISGIASQSTLVSSEILRVESLRALSLIQPESLGSAEEVLKTLNLVRVSRANLQLASKVQPKEIRTLDALHLSTALELSEDDLHFVSYDKRLLAAAKLNGLKTSSPGMI